MSSMIRRKFLKLLGLGVPLAPLVVGKVLAGAVEPTIKLADVLALKESCEKHYDHSLDAERYATLWVDIKDFRKMTAVGHDSYSETIDL